MTDQDKSQAQLAEENAALRKRLAESEQDAEAIKQLQWLLGAEEKLAFGVPKDEGYSGQNYADLVQLNTNRTIADSVPREILEGIAGDYLDLLGSSGAIYETNGDYALGIFSSGWCRFMDQVGRDLCDTDDDTEALNSGKWHCHESCWECSKESIETGQPADIACRGGIRLYAVPVVAQGEIVGSINFGYGDAPTDDEKLHELSLRYDVDKDVLRQKAEAYRSRPPFIIELAKKRLQTAANLIGEMVARRRAEIAQKQQGEEIKKGNAELERLNRLFVGREHKMIELKREINDMARAVGKPEPYKVSFTDADVQADGVCARVEPSDLEHPAGTMQ